MSDCQTCGYFHVCPSCSDRVCLFHDTELSYLEKRGLAPCEMWKDPDDD